MSDPGITVNFDVGATLTGLGLLVTAVFSGLALLQSNRNAKKIDKVEINTNSLTATAVAIAKKLGIEEGRASEKAERAERDVNAAAAAAAPPPAASTAIALPTSVVLKGELAKDDKK